MVLTTAAAAAAQDAPSRGPRADATAVVGWQLIHGDDRDFYRGRDWHSSFFTGGGGGLYWTAHLKTEVDAGTGTQVHTYRSRRLTINGRDAFQSSHRASSRRMVAVSQQYQFLENAWVHPHVAVGVNLTWERSREQFEPAFASDSATGRQELVSPARVEVHDYELSVRPFIGAGMKAYLSPRAFFRTDLRVAFDRGFDESLLRVGFGFDF